MLLIEQLTLRRLLLKGRLLLLLKGRLLLLKEGRLLRLRRGGKEASGGGGLDWVGKGLAEGRASRSTTGKRVKGQMRVPRICPNV